MRRYIPLLLLLACGAPPPPAPAPAPPASVVVAPPAVAAASAGVPAPPSASASAPESPPSIAPFARAATRDGRYVLVGYVTEIHDTPCRPCAPRGPDCAACPASFAYLADHDAVDDPAKVYVGFASGKLAPELLHQRVRAVVRVTHGTRSADRFVALTHVTLASAPPEPIPTDAIKATIKADVIPAPHPPPPSRPAEPLPDPGPSPTSPERAGLRVRLAVADCWREARKPITGAATIKIEIAPDGTVKAASATGSAPEEIRTCVVERVKPMQFGDALDGLRLQLDLTFAGSS